MRPSKSILGHSGRSSGHLRLRLRSPSSWTLWDAGWIAFWWLYGGWAIGPWTAAILGGWAAWGVLTKRGK